MKRVAEVMYIVESQRESFLKGALNLTEEEKEVLWLCGVRKQQYFALNELIIMTFEYAGKDFAKDMEKMAAYLDGKGLLIKTRRKDVPPSERTSTNWWAPIKRLGTLLETKPESFDEAADVDCLSMSIPGNSYRDISFDEEDWL